MMRKIASNGFSYGIKVPLQVAGYFMITASKFFVEAMVSAYVVPRAMRIWLAQAATVGHFDDESYAATDAFYTASISALVTYVVFDFMVSGARRFKSNYELITFNDGIRNKVQEAVVKLSVLPGVRKAALVTIFSVIFVLFYSGLYIYGIQSQKEFIKDHPDFLLVKKWNDNPYTQNVITAFLIAGSIAVNFFEGLHNAVVIADDKKMLFNRKIIWVVLASLTLAFTMRLFVLEYVKEKGADSQASIAMQISLVAGTVGWSVVTSGFSLTMNSDRRHIVEQPFYGKCVVQLILLSYFILGALLCQSLGNYQLLMDFVPSHVQSSQKSLSPALFILGVALSSTSMYLYVNYVKNKVYDSCSGRTNMGPSFFGKKTADRAKTPQGSSEQRPLLPVAAALS